MIKELATYEKALSSVHATDALLSETLTFAPSPADSKPEFAAHASSKPKTFASTFILIAPEGGVAGMALFYNTYSTWLAKPGVYLEDLFVRPAFRRRGYATLLLKELANEVKRINGGRLEWYVSMLCHQESSQQHMCIAITMSDLTRYRFVNGLLIVYCGYRSCLKWNESALKFYRGIGAEEMVEWVGLRVDGEKLPKLADMQIDVKNGV